MRYGQLPRDLGVFSGFVEEMFFYQYLPIKLCNSKDIQLEPRLNSFKPLISTIACDFVGTYGLDRFMKSYMYLTAKNLYQPAGKSFNRLGYHSDGFLTNDINYVWSDRCPTIFNTSDFKLDLEDSVSLQQMESQALPENETFYPEGSLLCLDQYNIHKVAENQPEGMRCFIKVSFSQDKYDLIGNAHNYLLDYKWEMRPRQTNRNIPQSL
jgi:hypothetical protein